MASRPITTQLVVAYSHCPRKAYNLLAADETAPSTDYARILEQRRQRNENEQLRRLAEHHAVPRPNGLQTDQHGGSSPTRITLRHGGLEAYCSILKKVSPSEHSASAYEPTLIVGTDRISDEQHLELLFAGLVLGQETACLPPSGQIIDRHGAAHRVTLKDKYRALEPMIATLHGWMEASTPQPSPVRLRKHCHYCPYEAACRAEAEKADDLSLLERMTPTMIQQYHDKGVFTVHQLSYHYRPRKGKHQPQNVTASQDLELQALAIRTQKVYLRQLPTIPRCEVGMYLDIEGIPDENFYYLIGLQVSTKAGSSYCHFWADTASNEENIWQAFLATARESAEAPILHYGRYELSAVNKLANRYHTQCDDIKARLFDIHSQIRGKVCFPVRSNGLKELGRLLGATWSSPDASGLQSLVWRYSWEDTQNPDYKEMLLTYNREDCEALALLANELSRIAANASSRPDLDFADQPKHDFTPTGSEVYHEFLRIRHTAFATYDQSKISWRSNRSTDDAAEKKATSQSQRHWKAEMVAKARQVVQVPMAERCPNCDVPLLESDRSLEWATMDIVATEDGCVKRITKHVGKKGYCPKCSHYHGPRDVGETGNIPVFGHGCQAWVMYQRLALRLPYSAIIQSLKDQFGECMSGGTVVNITRNFAQYYAETEAAITRQILKSPFVHVDETKMNIRGTDQYVWVFTDGNHVVFKRTVTREAGIVSDTLGDYGGVLVADFYGGYDALKYRQQKCLVHLVRDLNEDLWKSPLDGEYEGFVLEIKNLIVPILSAVDEFGLSKQHLSQYTERVDSFYRKMIDDRAYSSQLCAKYQKRFRRYRESMFRFLQEDSVPWNNNMAERAIRHLAVQRKISGFFFDTVASDYLLLLGIAQTCRFQGKSLLRFLMSGEKNVDGFRGAGDHP